MSDVLEGSGEGRDTPADDRPRAPMSLPITDLARPLDVSGKTVVVTGGSNGIGWGICRAFAERGAGVAILDIDTDGGRTAAGALRERGGDHIFVECDITDRGMVSLAVETVQAHFGRIDVLVNNAGIASIKAFLDMDPDLPEWHRVMDVNLNGTVYMTYAVAKAMRAAGRGGSIINISSIGGARCSGSKVLPQVGYVASKAAVNHLTASWAIEFAEYDIRVNCIMPGPTHSRLDRHLTPEYRAKIEEGILDRRYGEALEIGALCVFFSSPEGAHLNGVVMPHDGGFLCIN